jgi:putative transcriptional regulator
MSNPNTPKIVRYTRDNLPPGKTGWARIKAMTEDEINAAALSDPDAQPMTPEELAQMRPVGWPKRLRETLAMTQEEFAAAFRVPVGTLRDWEQRRSWPDAPARALLLAIERDPKRMKKLLASEAAE